MVSINISNFPRLSGETDDSPRIQRAVDAAPFGKVFLEAGRYLVASPIVITNFCSLKLDECAVIQAVAKMDFVVSWDGGTFGRTGDPRPEGEPSFNYPPKVACFFTGGVIDGAGLAGCFSVMRHKHFTLRDTCFLNGFPCGMQVRGGYELIATNIFCRCFIPGLKGNVGLSIKGGDSHYTDVVITDYEIGVEDVYGGSNRYTRVHVWNSVTSNIENCVNYIFRCDESDDYGEVVLDNCYADTGKIGFDIATTARLVNCTYFNNYAQFGLDDVVCIRNSSEKSVQISNCFFRKSSPKATLYEGCPEENVLLRDNILEEGLSWPKSLIEKTGK